MSRPAYRAKTECVQHHFYISLCLRGSDIYSDEFLFLREGGSQALIINNFLEKKTFVLTSSRYHFQTV